MIGLLRLALGDQRGAAAVEMALVFPLLLIIGFGSIELGNYFMNEHSLVKAVRDGARYAARRSFTDYPDCSTVSTGLRDATRNVVMNGVLSGGTLMTPNVQTTDITVSTSCATTAGGQSMTGIYTSRIGGAQIVTVSASPNYRPVLQSFGFSGTGYKLNATAQAAVAGI